MCCFNTKWEHYKNSGISCSLMNESNSESVRFPNVRWKAVKKKVLIKIINIQQKIIIRVTHICNTDTQLKVAKKHIE